MTFQKYIKLVGSDIKKAHLFFNTLEPHVRAISGGWGIAASFAFAIIRWLGLCIWGFASALIFRMIPAVVENVSKRKLIGNR
jgi:hypothetical protein